jgi:hypothetical protein
MAELVLFLQELASLEVEPLEVLVYPSESEQESRLDTLTTESNDIGVTHFSTDKRAFPVNDSACCCCCPCCCCACACAACCCC